MKRAFEARTGGVWPLNIGQVYTTLARLERDGLVATSGAHGAHGARGDAAGERQHVYSITAAGRRELAGWFAESQARRRALRAVSPGSAPAAPGGRRR